MSESLNIQSLIVCSNQQSSAPSITVQIVESKVPTALSLDGLYPASQKAARAGRMGGIVPLKLSNFHSQAGLLNHEMLAQLKEFASTPQGADCLRYFGYNFDIQKLSNPPESQVETALSLDVGFQALEQVARAGRMGGIIPLSKGRLHSQALTALNEDLRKQLKEFACTKQGSKCLRYFGYYLDIQEPRAYPVSANGPVKNKVEAVDEVLVEGPGQAFAEPLVQASFESAVEGPIEALAERAIEAPFNPSFATEELKTVTKVAEPDPKDLLLRQKIRKAIEKSNPKSNIIEIWNNRRQKRQVTLTPKEKSLRQALTWVASVCLAISCAAEIQFLAEKRSLPQVAKQNLFAGDLLAARTGFEKIIQTQPDNWEAYLGHASTIPNEYAKQVVDYTQVLAIKPGEPHAVFGLAKAHYELGDYNNAIAFANKSIAQSPTPEALEVKAKSLMHLRNFHDASRVFEQILAKPSKPSAELYYQLASCQKELGNRNQQREYLRKASKLDPKNISYLNQLAMLLVADKDFEEAKLVLQKAVSIKAKEPGLHVRLANVYTQLNSPQKAINELSQVIDHDLGPKADILKRRAALFCSMNKYGRALADVDSAMVLKPTDKTLPKMRERIVSQLAIIKDSLDRQLARTQRDSNAVLVAKASPATPMKTADPSPTAVDTALSQQIVLKAFKHIKKGDFKTAIPMLQAALKKDPENSEAHRYLAFSYFHSGLVNKALVHSKQVVALGTEHPHDLFSLGEAHFYDGKPQEAIKFYRDALRKDPLHVEARMGAIRSLIAMGKVHEATSACEEAAYSSRSEKAKFKFKRMLNEMKSRNQIASTARSFKS